MLQREQIRLAVSEAKLDMIIVGHCDYCGTRMPG
jgi:hypothetical protein